MDAVETPYDDAPPHDGEEPPHGAVDAFESRQPPRNIEAEAGLLGAVFIDNRCLEACEDQGLSRDDFYLPAHGMIYGACLQLWRGGSIADPTTLRPHFQDADELKEIGGAAYLGNLMANAVSTFNAKEYARIIRDCSIKRDLIAAGEELVSEAYEADLDTPAAAILERGEQRLFEISSADTSDDGVPLEDQVERAIRKFEERCDRGGGLVGVTTGSRTLDHILGGLRETDLIVLGGRPGMGKSALAGSIAYAAAKAAFDGRDGGAPVAFYSGEMSDEQLLDRMASAVSGVDHEKVRTGRDVSSDERWRFIEALREIKRLPLFINDRAGWTPGKVHRWARRLIRKHGVGLVVIDYLGRMRPDLPTGNDTSDVGQMARACKDMAKALRVPVFLLSQLSRQVESRENKRPHMGDLRQSGEIEQEADIVMFAYREQYYLEREEPQQRSDEDDGSYATKVDRWKESMKACQNKLQVIGAKSRHSPTFDAHLYCDLSKFIINDLASQDVA